MTGPPLTVLEIHSNYNYDSTNKHWTSTLSTISTEAHCQDRDLHQVRLHLSDELLKGLHLVPSGVIVILEQHEHFMLCLKEE
jgi:hypothetical protein